MRDFREKGGRLRDTDSRPAPPPPLLPGPFYLVFICLGMEIHEHEFETKGSKT